MKNTACSHARVPAGCFAHVPCANAGVATSSRTNNDLNAVRIFVGAALCGRPCLDLARRAATEGRPYNNARELNLSECYGTGTPKMRAKPSTDVKLSHSLTFFILFHGTTI